MSSDNDFKKSLKDLRPEDFDGYTNFDKLTDEQKLEWLSNMAKFLWLSRQG